MLISVQAKGYPDLLTQSFLRLIHSTSRHLPIMILVDCDPDGLNILFFYRYGSNTQRRATSVAITGWGIKTSHILDTGNRAFVDNNDRGRNRRRVRTDEDMSTDSSQNSASGIPISSTACREPVTQVSMRDRKLAIGTLKKLSALPQADNFAAELKMELQRMLMLGVKTEIQWLDESGSITQWLDREMGVSLGLDGT